MTLGRIPAGNRCMHLCLQLQVLLALILQDRLTEPHQMIRYGDYWASGEDIHLSPPPPPPPPPPPFVNV
jgi:hypothetical protein